MKVVSIQPSIHQRKSVFHSPSVTDTQNCIRKKGSDSSLLFSLGIWISFTRSLLVAVWVNVQRLLWNYQPQCPLAGASRIFKGWSHLSRQTEREILKGVGEHDGPVNLIWLISNEVFAYGLFGDFHVCACVCACICVCVLASAIDTQWHLGCQSSVIEWLSHTHEYSVSVHAWP